MTVQSEVADVRAIFLVQLIVYETIMLIVHYKNADILKCYK